MNRHLEFITAQPISAHSSKGLGLGDGGFTCICSAYIHIYEPGGCSGRNLDLGRDIYNEYERCGTIEGKKMKEAVNVLW